MSALCEASQPMVFSGHYSTPCRTTLIGYQILKLDHSAVVLASILGLAGKWNLPSSTVLLTTRSSKVPYVAMRYLEALVAQDLIILLSLRLIPHRGARGRVNILL